MPFFLLNLRLKIIFMKTMYNKLNSFQLFITTIIISFLFISCDFYNFSEPQPYDKEKLYRFPDELQGKWKGKDSAITYGIDFTVPVNGKGGYLFNTEYDRGNKMTLENTKEDTNFYCIYKNYMILVFSEKEKIITGAWPKLIRKNEFMYPPKRFGHQYEIKYDSLNKPVDTISKYIISGNRIYEKDEDRYLSRGYDFTRVKDTITILKKDSVYIDLGQNAFLRKLTDSIYVLNINNTILALGEREDWWRLIILEIAGKDKFIEWECSGKTGELPCMFYDRPSKYDQFYFDCRWSSSEMLRLMKDGYFEKTEFRERVAK